MKCIICGDVSTFYFNKKFQEFDLCKVKYYKCNNCGFVISKTHLDLSTRRWEKLNYDAHILYNSKGFDPNNRPPPYLQQALMIKILIDHKLIRGNNYLDWASGEGKLSLVLKKYFDIRLDNYDKYIKPKINSVTIDEINGKKFSLVISSALFEHIRDIYILNSINELVSTDGVLLVHTLIREEIPKDPKWFYLLPVHCAFHTNKSMDILMDKWNYCCSIYCLEAKMWVLFKTKSMKIQESVKSINKALGYSYLLYKNGFVDYWE